MQTMTGANTGKPFRSVSEAGCAFDLERISDASNFDLFMEFVRINRLGDDGLGERLTFWTDGGVSFAKGHAAAIQQRGTAEGPLLAKDAALCMTVAVEALVMHCDREFARGRGLEAVKNESIPIAVSLANSGFDQAAAEVLRQYARAIRYFEGDEQRFASSPLGLLRSPSIKKLP